MRFSNEKSLGVWSLDPFWWSIYWLIDLLRWTLGIHYHHHYAWNEPWFRWGMPGFLYDLQTFYRRGRYGWAPRDTWNLDHHWLQVMGQSLIHLAEHHSGSPVGFPRTDEPYTEAERCEASAKAWETFLRTTGGTFLQHPDDVDIYDAADGYKLQWAEEQRRRDAIVKAWHELEPWLWALWD